MLATASGLGSVVYESLLTPTGLGASPSSSSSTEAPIASTVSTAIRRIIGGIMVSASSLSSTSEISSQRGDGKSRLLLRSNWTTLTCDLRGTSLGICVLIAYSRLIRSLWCRRWDKSWGNASYSRLQSLLPICRGRP